MFPFYMMLTEFFEKLKVFSSDFSMMKDIAAALSSSSLQITLLPSVNTLKSFISTLDVQYFQKDAHE